MTVFQYYLDANVFIYATSGGDSSKEAKAAKKVLEKAASGQARYVTSLLSWDEIVWQMRGFSHEAGAASGKLFLELPGVIAFPVTAQVIDGAQRLLGRYGLKPRDAIHASTAIISGCKAVITEDRDFDLLRGEIPRIGLEHASALR